MTTTPPDGASDAAASAAGDDDADRAAGGTPALGARLSAAGGVVLLCLVVAIAVTAAVFHGGGGRWFIVSTASMGQSAPVGTLVITSPDTASRLSVGDIISFRPPTAGGQVYTHRVDGFDGSGAVRTRGDVNGAADPWALTDADIIGRVMLLIPGAGWAIRAVPLLAVGFAALWFITGRFVSTDNRSAARITGACLVVSCTTALLKPLVGVAMLSTYVEGGFARATVVSTGVLPIRAEVTGGTHVDLVSGMVGTVSAPARAIADAYDVTTALHLPPAGWLVLGGICALPLLWCLVVGLPPRAEKPELR